MDGDKANRITPGVIGAVVGAGVLFFVVFIPLRRRKRHRAEDAVRQRWRHQIQRAPQHRSHLVPTFEPTTDVQIIIPFPAPPRPSRQSIDKGTNSDTAKELAPSYRQDTATGPVAEEKRPAGRFSDTQKADASTTAADSIEAVRPRRQRSEDMEDARENELLPPEYKEVWGERHSAALEGARGADRSEKGGHRV